MGMLFHVHVGVYVYLLLCLSFFLVCALTQQDPGYSEIQRDNVQA